MFKFLRERKKDNKGFTLVELVIVVAILAILVGLLAPQYTKYVEKSRKSADASNMDEMVKAVQVYAADGAEAMPEKKDGVKITLGTAPTDENIKKALDEFCPDYVNMKVKSKKWTDTPNATIKVDANGAVTVTYGPDDFADFIEAAKTKTTGA